MVAVWAVVSTAYSMTRVWTRSTGGPAGSLGSTHSEVVVLHDPLSYIRTCPFGSIRAVCCAQGPCRPRRS